MVDTRLRLLVYRRENLLSDLKTDQAKVDDNKKTEGKSTSLMAALTGHLSRGHYKNERKLHVRR